MSPINPILMLELRAGLRTRRFAMAFFVSLLLLSLLAIGVLAEQTRAAPGSQVGGAVLARLLLVQLYLILMILPAFSCTAIVGEREQQTFELLLSTGLTPARIVAGKLLAGSVTLALLLVSTLPLAAVAYLYGGLSVLQITVGYLLLVLAGLLVALYALFTSAIATSSVRAIAATYAVLTGLVALPVGIAARTPSLLAWFDPARWAALPADRRTSWLLVAALAYVALATLLLLVTINRLRPSGANPSTPLRLYHLALVPLLGLTLVHLRRGLALDADDALRTLFVMRSVWGVAGLALGIAIFLATEDRTTSRQVAARVRRLPGPLRWLRPLIYPGGHGGPLFALVMTVLLLGMVLAVHLLDHRLTAIPATDMLEAPGRALPASCLTLGSYLMALIGLGHWLCGLIRERRTRIGWLGVFLMLTVLGPVALHVLDNGSTQLHALSPFLCTAADWTPAEQLRARGLELTLWSTPLRISDVGRPLYVVLAGLFVLLASIDWRRERPAGTAGETR